MKVKNIWISCLERKNIQKLVIVKESSLPKKILRFALKEKNDEYKCVFTNKSYYLKMDDIEPLAIALSIEQAKRRINKKELKEFYKENEKQLILNLSKTKKQPIGFRL